MGLAIFLASLAVLFLASLVGYWAVRANNPDWAQGLPELPRTLWWSTLLLLASSGTMHWALRGARRGDQGALSKGMVATTALGVAFLLIQVAVWWSLVDANLTGRESLYGFTFYLLTGLHGAHVVGGLLPMSITTARAFKGRYSAESHDGVLMCAMYWHFLDAVWVLLFANLVLLG